ncbi:MAG TPA: hypothetical protein VHS09_00620, partial [Polyangiaceae bacterium]|nr:hypothetical protein [Polyangiaceae bacterium]
AFSPSAAAVAKLVERLRKEKWLPAGGRAVITVDNEFGDDTRAKLAASTKALPPSIDTDWLDDPDHEELRMVWRVEDGATSAVKYPLTRRPEGASAYAFELHRSHDYVYPSGATIEPISTTCVCGEELGFHWDEEEVVPTFGGASGIFAECEACSRTFDPTKGAAVLTNPFDRTKTPTRGGAAYRFALKVDCGKTFVADARLAFAPELVTLVEDEFGREFFQVGTLRR